MIVNNKYFCPPPKKEDTFKVLFLKMMSAGSGRPVNKYGYAEGPWTPELLASTLSEIVSNEDGVELRSVQRWFQENDQNIGLANMQLLAILFGCGDSGKTNNWLKELNRSRLQQISERNRAKAYETRKRSEAFAIHSEIMYAAAPVEMPKSVAVSSKITPNFNLVNRTEMLFSSKSSLSLPVMIFTGACSLAVISFTINIHSIVFTPSVGSPKQVGFMWAPNWTIVFLILLPLYLSLLIELTRHWKSDWRAAIEKHHKPNQQPSSWSAMVQTSSYSLWATLFITIVIASGYNWVITHLMPLLDGNAGRWPVDWGRIAIFRPDIVSVPSAIVFSGLVFLYNGFAAYFFFAGLIFIHLLKQDYLELMRALPNDLEHEKLLFIERISFRLLNGIYRCTALAAIVAIMMKLQSEFLHSDNGNILQWLTEDARSILTTSEPTHASPAEVMAPGLYYSFLSLLAIVGTFVICTVRVRYEMSRRLGYASMARHRAPCLIMIGSISILTISYLLIGKVQGFSLFLLFSLALTGYFVIKPDAHWVETKNERSI